MSKISLFLMVAATAFSQGASSALISKATIETNAGNIVIELYDDAPLVSECRGTNSLGAIANLETDKGIVGYGTGCWTADAEGYIHLRIKSFDDGVARESAIHNSKFVSISEKENSNSEIGLVAISNDDPVLARWREISPVYSVLDNCKLLERMLAIKGEESEYQFASMDPPNDLFIYKEINKKAHWSEVYAVSESGCQNALSALKSAKLLGLNVQAALKKARFGLAVDDLTPEMKAEIKYGALVVSVLDSSAALKAGVEVNDVIVAVDGIEVKSASEALSAMRNLPEDSKKSTLTVIRQGGRVALGVSF